MSLAVLRTSDGTSLESTKNLKFALNGDVIVKLTINETLIEGGVSNPACKGEVCYSLKGSIYFWVLL